MAATTLKGHKGGLPLTRDLRVLFIAEILKRPRVTGKRQKRSASSNKNARLNKQNDLKKKSDKPRQKKYEPSIFK